MTGRTELRALTSVRGIAAWAVVLYHIRLSMNWAPQGVIDVLAKGYLAVDFFFLLSGFVIWMTWAGRLSDGGYAAVPDFLKRRIARIWPLHLVILSFAVVIMAASWAIGRPDPHFPPAELPAHLLLIQAWGFGAETLAWNDPAWSISTEMFAYLLFPLLVSAVDWRRQSSVNLMCAAAALLLILSGIWWVRGVKHLGDYIPQLGLVRCVLEFTTGTIVGALWLRWHNAPRVPAMAAVAVATIAFAAFALGAPEAFVVPLGLAASLLAIALTSGNRYNPLESKVLHYLGEISFATYLSHTLLWKVFKLALVDDPHAVPPVLTALYLLLVFGASVSLYHLVERPAQRWLNGLKLAQRRAASV